MLITPIRSRASVVGKVLLISNRPEVRDSLGRIFNHSNWLLGCVSTCREAIAYLSGNDTPVVICDQELPDGNWKVVLNAFDSLPVPPILIVTARLADEYLWAEVLNLGGYDVLPQPFDPQEIYRIVCLAWHAHKTQTGASAGRESRLEPVHSRARAAS